jgi:Holliday junction resolvase RusA-like endonuclease
MTRLSEAAYKKLLADNPDVRPLYAAHDALYSVEDAAPVQSSIRTHKASVRLTLAPERPLSRNVTLRMHWATRRRAYAAISRRMHLLAQAYASAAQHACPLPYHVTITVTVYYKSKPHDVDNVDVKPYIDALKGVLIVDDDPAHVHSLVIVKLDKRNPRVEIELKPTGGT